MELLTPAQSHISNLTESTADWLWKLCDTAGEIYSALRAENPPPAPFKSDWPMASIIP